MSSRRSAKLGPELVDALKALPLGRSPNRVGVALSILGLKQAAIVRRTGLSAVTVSDVVRGDYRELSLENARLIAEFFECPIEVLFPRVKAVA